VRLARPGPCAICAHTALSGPNRHRHPTTFSSPSTGRTAAAFLDLHGGPSIAWVVEGVEKKRKVSSPPLAIERFVIHSGPCASFLFSTAGVRDSFTRTQKSYKGGVLLVSFFCAADSLEDSAHNPPFD